MFLPARMTRLLVGGHLAHQAGVIEVLHQEKAVHLEDYLDPTRSTRIGEPLAQGESVSELLVRLRGLQKSLGVPAGGKVMAASDPARILAEAEAAAGPGLARAAELKARLQAVAAEQALLAPLASLPVELSLVAGLRSVRGFLGSTRGDPRPALAGLSAEVHAAEGGRGFAVACFVAARDAGAAEKALAESGFQAIEAPAGATGTPTERLSRLAAEAARLQADLAGVESGLEEVRHAWGPRLGALEAFLSSEAEKTQAPLRFAHTDATFHLEGWVPRRRVGRVKNALAARFGEAIYVEELGDAPRTRDAAHGDPSRDGHGAAPHAGDARDEPPIHLENPKPAKPYEFLLGLLGKPRYGEIDPTKLMLVFFPLFFGLMVGDLAVGLIIVGVGFYLKSHRLFGIGGPAVGKALIAGGLMAALVGGVVFGEALGIHFLTPEPHGEGEEKEISWEEILGLHVPSEGFLHRTGDLHGEAVQADAASLTPHQAETDTEKGLLSPHTDQHLSVNGWFNLGYYSKIHDIQALLVWSLLIGIVHLVLGFGLGIRNVYRAHGLALAIQEKAAWLFLMGGLTVLAWALASGAGGLWVGVGGGIAVASVALLWMGAAHTIGVGFVALLEVPSLFGNLLSYTRLAAIGASKAGMAVAFAAIGFDTLGGGSVHSAVGWIVYLLGFSLLIVLSILAGSLQSLRLQFVEFFGKFYQGGGRAYVPFGRRAA